MAGQESPTPNRTAIVHTLAIIGFIALMGAAMWLAVYSTRFVPGVVGRLGSAAVYLGSVFAPAPEPSLLVVPTPTASTTISFGEAEPATKAAASKPTSPTVGKKTTSTYQISGAIASTSVPIGLPDLVVSINAVGYLATSSAESFIASSTVPSNGRAAVNFIIKNVGTGIAGPWRFSATIPTQSFYLYQSQPQQLLAPGDSIEYTLGFDQATAGVEKMISITANYDHAVAESNPNNNSASAKITVLGS